MKVDMRFHCFACQADGDAVDFVSRLFGLPSKEAAMKLADDFGIGYDSKQKPSVRPKIREPTPEQRYQQEENRCYKVLTDYFHSLRAWKQQYAPKQPGDEWHPLFVEALQRESYIEYLLDILLYGTPEEKNTEEELKDFEPDFVVYNASKAKVENYKELGLNSETAVMFNITSREQVIVNTWYGGEMKKGMFSMMNYYLPLKGIASMHCSANTDMNGENTALFFGLSGTGKTTLSTDPKRLLIGDDEHGWDDNGVFNFEGGCYAKVINLDKESEPDIYNAIRRDALLENVTLDAEGKIDFNDKSVTENTRVSYPINHIENIVRPVSSAPAAKNVIFLSADV